MLKTLRITSLIALAAVACGVVALGVLAFRGDPEMVVLLDKPGVVETAREQFPDEGDTQEIESPLVVQSKLFALRLDPPPPPQPKVEPKAPPKAPPVARVEPKAPPVAAPPPRPKTTVSAKFTLLATVLCVADPTRSMALLKQSAGQEEWFRQGERVGHLDVEEVRNGSVVFSQGGRNPQELFVPEKPTVKSLLKSDAAASTASASGPGSINVTLGGEPDAVAEAVTEPAAPTPVTTAAGRVRIERSAEDTATRQAVTERIRTRVAPKVRTPEEQKASIESNIDSIQEIMSRDTSGDPEQQKKENEAWLKLLKALEGEKDNLGVAVEGAAEAAPDEGADEGADAETEDD